MKLIASKLGFNLTIQKTSDGEMWGRLLNGTSFTGMKGDVQKGLVDIGFGGMWAVASNYKFFDFTQPYSYDYFIFLVPVPKIKAYWMTYFLALEYRIWLLCLGTAVLSILTLIVLKNVRAAPDHVLDTTSTSVLVLHLFGLFFYNSHERTMKIKYFVL